MFTILYVYQLFLSDQLICSVPRKLNYVGLWPLDWPSYTKHIIMKYILNILYEKFGAPLIYKNYYARGSRIKGLQTVLLFNKNFRYCFSNKTYFIIFYFITYLEGY